MSAKYIGTVVQYLAQTGAAVINVTEDEILMLGDTIEIGTGYSQKVSYLEANRKSVNEVRRGDVASIKVDRPVFEGDTVYKL